MNRTHRHFGGGSVASGERACQLSVNLFDYGVASALYRIPIPPGTTLEELLPLAEELQSPTPEVDAAARREVEEIARGLRAALDRPHAWEGIETYTVFLVQAFDAPPRPRDLLSQETLARLLLGERSRTPLAAAEREDVLGHHFSYLEDDLAVVDWNSAFVLEPSGGSDIPDLLEFVTAQLLELRYYDALLDRELRRIYDEMEVSGRPSWAVLTRRQKQVAAMTCQGLPARQIASLLDTSTSNVYQRLAEARKRMHAADSADLKMILQGYDFGEHTADLDSTG